LLDEPNLPRGLTNAQRHICYVQADSPPPKSHLRGMERTQPKPDAVFDLVVEVIAGHL
jgi:hypothetical protein